MAELLIDNMRLPKNLYGVHVIIKPNGDVQDYLNGAVFAKAIQLQPHGELKDMKMIEKTICEYLGIKDISCLTPAERSVYNCICYTPNAVEATDG